jgi:protein required for attachment to host cells
VTHGDGIPNGPDFYLRASEIIRNALARAYSGCNCFSERAKAQRKLFPREAQSGFDLPSGAVLSRGDGRRQRRSGTRNIPASARVLVSDLKPAGRKDTMNELKLKHGLWVVIADGEKALFLENAGDAKDPDFKVVQEMEHGNPATREQGVERPGRHSDGPSPHNSAYAETDWHRLGKERFADNIAERLYKLAHRGAFDEIVLVAPPQVLGEMRKKLHKEVGDKVTAEIAKTLTNQPVWDIEALLKAA